MIRSNFFILSFVYVLSVFQGIGFVFDSSTGVNPTKIILGANFLEI